MFAIEVIEFATIALMAPALHSVSWVPPLRWPEQPPMGNRIITKAHGTTGKVIQVIISRATIQDTRKTTATITSTRPLTAGELYRLTAQLRALKARSFEP